MTVEGQKRLKIKTKTNEKGKAGHAERDTLGPDLFFWQKIHRYNTVKNLL